VVARLREILLSSVKLAVDETPVPVLDPGRGRTKIGYFWSMARDDRPWGSDDPPAVAYSYAPGRGAEHAIKLLAGYCGIVQCDGYAAYKQLLDRRRNSGLAALAFCWAHWRRRFYEIAKAGPAPIAQEALARIAALYAIEKRIRGRSAAERVAVRQAESKPLIVALKSWLESELRSKQALTGICSAAASQQRGLGWEVLLGADGFNARAGFLRARDRAAASRSGRFLTAAEPATTPTGVTPEHQNSARRRNATVRPRDQLLDEHRFRSLGKLVVGNLDRIADVNNVGN
jgi:Transposase IS66 family